MIELSIALQELSPSVEFCSILLTCDVGFVIMASSEIGEVMSGVTQSHAEGHRIIPKMRGIFRKEAGN